MAESQSIAILSGTRSEMGGVDVGLANIFERPEHPGGLSALLILPDGDQVVMAGSRITLGGQTFTLTAFKAHRTGTYEAIFERLVPDPAPFAWPDPERFAIAPTGAGRLTLVLRAVTPQILALLNKGDADLPKLTPSEQRNETMVREWNGGEVGPNTSAEWLIHSDDKTIEARIALETIRWNADEIYRMEVSAYWRVGNTHVSISGRGEGLAPVTELLTARDAPAIAPIIIDALTATP